MSGVQRSKPVVLAVLVVVVAVIVTAFALGGRHSVSSGLILHGSNGLGATRPAVPRDGAGGLAPIPGPTIAAEPKVAAGSGSGSATTESTTASAAVPDAAGASGSSAGAGSSTGSFRATDADSISGGVEATRVVKTGSLDLQVHKGQVPSTIAKLDALINRMNGYVSESRTDNSAGSPDGEVTLRMPVANFDDTVTDAEALGHETSLNTRAHDVTGKFVDLGARLSALKRTRSTYLTILGRARTIGSTLAVQQRVDDVQQQIEELQGQLKVLRNQSSDGTLDVDVSQVGSVAQPAHHHKRHGISKAWHTSISRFDRGIDAIVGDLGPLLLALLILGFLIGVGRLTLHGARRGETHATT